LRWGERGAYRDIGGWAWATYNRVVQRFGRAPLPFRGAVRRIGVRSLDAPVDVRINTSDVSVLHEFALYGGYQEFVESIEGPIDTIVDLGSNIGISLRYWKTLWPTARLVAVEPDPDNIEMLRRNAALGGLDPVIVAACASGRAGEVGLDRSGGYWGVRMTRGSPETVRVPAMTVPEILLEAGIDGDVDLLKCDIEGAESEVFSDCASWIGRVRNLIIETHAPYTIAELDRDLKRNGFDRPVGVLKQQGATAVAFYAAEACVCV
jgi:FkbM family methyltransferase